MIHSTTNSRFYTRTNRRFWSVATAWAAFVCVVGAIAHLALSACDLGPPSLFGLNYCGPKAPDHRLVMEQEREHVLLDRLHALQLTLNRLPICLPEPAPPAPDRRAENVAPLPQPAPPADEQLTIPLDMKELSGCWQSARGDLPVYSDDQERRVIGHTRICYCFGSNGNGQARAIQQGGVKCTGSLTAQLSEGRLIMHAGQSACSDSSIINPADITCLKKPGDDSASCDRVSRSKFPVVTRDQKYRRVSAEYCN
jgi:hypothetical protein